MLGNRTLGQCPGCVGTGTPRIETLALQLVVSLCNTEEVGQSSMPDTLNTNFQSVAQETRLSLYGACRASCGRRNKKSFQRV